MASIDPNILELIDAGELVQYRDAAGRAYTVADLIDAKKKGTYNRLRPSLIPVEQRVLHVPRHLGVPDLKNKAIRNTDLVSALTTANIPLTTNDKGPKMQPLFESSNAALLEANYGTSIRANSFIAMFEDINPQDIPELMDRLLPKGLLNVSATNNRVLSYNQQPRNVGANKAVFATTRSVLELIAEQDPTNPTVSKLSSLLNEMNTISSTHFFGNGSILGQIGRLEVGFKHLASAQRMRSGRPEWPSLTDNDTFFAVMDKRRPISAIQTDDPLTIRPIDLLSGPTVTVFDPLNGEPIQISLLHFTKAADAGFPWESNASKGDTLIADIMILQAMHDELENATTTTKFMEKFEWSRFYKIKAKAEIYEFTKMNTKIRNIMVPANVTMILPQMLFKLSKWYTSTYQRRINQNSLNSSLMGYAPFHGGHERLIEPLRKGVRSVLHYADNLFIFEGRKFASMDVSSMEVVHNTCSVQLCLRYIMTRAFGATFDGDKLVDGGRLGNIQAWLIYNWFGTFAADSSGALRSFLLPIPGLASGVPGTFEFNDMVMALGAEALTTLPENATLLDQTGKPNPMVIQKLNTLGFTIKTESYAPGPPDAPTNTLTDAFEQPWDPLDEDPNIAPTDMLGFDTTYVIIDPINGDYDPVPIATLSRARLLKAIIFNKSDLSNAELGPNTITIIQLATLNILYLSGGWAHADIALSIEVTAKALLAELSLTATISSIDDSNAASAITAAALARAATTVGAENAIDEDMARGLLRSMLATGLIPLTEVFRITHSQELSDKLKSEVIAHPDKYGDKLMRLVGPIVIAENIDAFQVPGAHWSMAAVNTARRALEHLEPLMKGSKTGPSTSQLESHDDPMPPQPERPSVIQFAKRPRPTIPETLAAIIHYANTEMPTATPADKLQFILNTAEMQTEGTDNYIQLEVEDNQADIELAAALALANAAGIPELTAVDHINDVTRLIATGVLRPTRTHPPAKRRRTKDTVTLMD